MPYFNLSLPNVHIYYRLNLSRKVLIFAVRDQKYLISVDTWETVFFVFLKPQILAGHFVAVYSRNSRNNHIFQEL